MTEEQAFLQRIIADPEDEAHRLVFADWLEEQGRAWEASRLRMPEGSWLVRSRFIEWRSYDPHEQESYQLITFRPIEVPRHCRDEGCLCRGYNPAKYYHEGRWVCAQCKTELAGSQFERTLRIHYRHLFQAFS